MDRPLADHSCVALKKYCARYEETTCCHYGPTNKGRSVLRVSLFSKPLLPVGQNPGTGRFPNLVD